MIEQKVELYNCARITIHRYSRYMLEPATLYTWGKYELLAASYLWDRYSVDSYYTWSRWYAQYVNEYKYGTIAAQYLETSDPYVYLLATGSKPSRNVTFGLNSSDTVNSRYLVSKSENPINAYKGFATPSSEKSGDNYVVVTGGCGYNAPLYAAGLSGVSATYANAIPLRNIEDLSTSAFNYTNKYCEVKTNLYYNNQLLCGAQRYEEAGRAHYNVWQFLQKDMNFINLSAGEDLIDDSKWAMLLPCSWIDDEGYLHDYLPMTQTSVNTYPTYVRAVDRKSSASAYSGVFALYAGVVYTRATTTNELTAATTPTYGYNGGVFTFEISHEEKIETTTHLPDITVNENRYAYPDNGIENGILYVYQEDLTVHNQGELLDTVSAATQDAYPEDGVAETTDGTYWFEYKGQTGEASKGAFIEQVTSYDLDAYPRDGYTEDMDYWYVLKYGETGYTKGDHVDTITELGPVHDYYQPAHVGIGYWYEILEPNIAGDPWVITNEHLVNGVDYTTCISDGTSSIKYGAVVGSEIQFTINYKDLLKYVPEGMSPGGTVKYYIKNPSGTWNYVGEYQIDTCDLVNHNQMKIKAYDKISHYYVSTTSNDAEIEIESGTTMAQLLGDYVDISAAASKDLSVTGFNKSATEVVTTSPKKYTYNQVMKGFAEINCGWFVSSTDSNYIAVFKTWNDRRNEIRLDRTQFVSYQRQARTCIGIDNADTLVIPWYYDGGDEGTRYYTPVPNSSSWTYSNTKPENAVCYQLSADNPFVYQTGFQPDTAATWSALFNRMPYWILGRQKAETGLPLMKYYGATLQLLDDKGIDIGDIITVIDSADTECYLHVCQKDVKASGVTLKCFASQLSLGGQ